jgi:uncharacterized membrane protein
VNVGVDDCFSTTPRGHSLMRDKVDLSTTIAGAVPIVLQLLTTLGVAIPIERQMAVSGLVVLLVSFFVGKPSGYSKRTRAALKDDLIGEGGE